MDEAQKATFLKDEYLHIQKVIEDFDGRALTIKAWSVTFSLGAIAGAFATHAALALLLASVSAGLFWLVEGMWKTFQDGYYGRAQELEAFFSGRKADLIPLQIGSSWHTRWRDGGRRRLRTIMRWPHVALPHVLVIAIGLVLYGLHLAGRLKL